MGSEPDFQVEVRRGAEGFVVTPRGELDIATVPVVRGALADRSPGEALVLDLGQLAFMDTSGIQLVVEAHRAARAEGFRLSVLRGPPSIQRVFEISGLADVLPFADGSPGGR